MAVPLRDDPQRLRSRLAGWLDSHAADGGRWELSGLTVPDNRGLSSEILLVEADWTGPDGRRVPRPLVARLAPTRFHLHPWDRFAEQCRLLEVLAGETSLPVSPVYGVEQDPEVLGAPFVVLGYVEGDVPPDIPPYHMYGFMLAMSPAERARLWDAALVAMARVHALEPEALGLDFVGSPGAGAQLAAYEGDLDFFEVAPAHLPVVRAALAWLHAHPPAERHPVRLLWGDARIGNVVFRGTQVAALLDWEMPGLGQPEADLAWFLHLDRHLSEGVGVPRLDGLPARGWTVARYGELIGRPLEDVDVYAVLASLRHTLLASRLTGLLTQYGMLPAGVEIPLGAYAADLLGRILDEAGD